MMHIPEFAVSPEVKTLGVRVICAVVKGLRNLISAAEFEVYRSELSQRLREELPSDFLKTDPVLAGFRELHEKVGRSNRRYPASPESLVRLF